MKFSVAALLLGATMVVTPAYGEEKTPPSTAEAAKPQLSTGATAIGEILDSPAAKAIVEKHLPGFSAHPQIDMARSFTLKVVQGFQPGMITDDILARIDADFAELQASKPG